LLQEEILKKMEEKKRKHKVVLSGPAEAKPAGTESAGATCVDDPDVSGVSLNTEPTAVSQTVDAPQPSLLPAFPLSNPEVAEVPDQKSNMRSTQPEGEAKRDELQVLQRRIQELQAQLGRASERASSEVDSSSIPRETMQGPKYERSPATESLSQHDNTATGLQSLALPSSVQHDALVIDRSVDSDEEEGEIIEPVQDLAADLEVNLSIQREDTLLDQFRENSVDMAAPLSIAKTNDDSENGVSESDIFAEEDEDQENEDDLAPDDIDMELNMVSSSSSASDDSEDDEPGEATAIDPSVAHDGSSASGSSSQPGPVGH